MNVVQKLKRWAAALAVLAVVATPALVPVTVSASCSNPKDCLNKGADNVKTGRSNLPSFIKDVTNVMLFLLGAIAVIMLVVGGIKYTTSNGNADQIKSAKNTIMYAIVGLVVAIMAYAVVNFVVNALLA